MKTFLELQDEACRKDENQLYRQINDWAAKEYAKQWIEYVAAKAQTEMVPGMVKWIDATSIRNVKKEIDTHG
jgi:hypothetical protein